MKKKKLLIIVIAVIVLAAGVVGGIFLFGGKKGEKAAPPEQYLVGGVAIPALEAEDAPVILSMVSLTEEGETEDEEEDSEEEPKESGTPVEAPAIQGYRYKGLASPKGSVESYVALLTGEEQGFVAVDEEMREVPLLEAYEEVSQLTLAKEFAGEGEQKNRLIQLHLNWNPDQCTVSLTMVEGRIRGDARQMSSMEAIAYMRSLSPSALGLPGESMQEYNIYTLDGGVFVNGEPCVRLNICYRDTKTETNDAAGFYYLSCMERRIYRHDLNTNQVTEIKGAHALVPPAKS